MPARTESSALLRIIITVLLALGVISVAPAAFAAIPFYAPISDAFIIPKGGSSLAPDPSSGPS